MQNYMLLVFAGTLQAVLILEILIRRIIEIFIPVQKSEVQSFADTSALSVFAAACLQVATIPLQAVISLITSFNRYLVLIFTAMLLFIVLYILSNTSVYVFSIFVRVYNEGVAPIVSTMRIVFVFVDFILRIILPVYNAFSFFTSQLLTRIIVPFGFNNMQEIPDILQNLALFFVSLGRSVLTWLQHIMDCTVLHQPSGFKSVCGNMAQNSTNMTSTIVDCSTVFVTENVRCFATSSHLSLDLLTPGIYMRQTSVGLQNILTSHCGLAALVLNLITSPLTDHHTYVAFHTVTNSLLYGFIGLPIATIRRCEWAMQKDFSILHQKISCTPDWEPLADLISSGFESVGTVMNNWLNIGMLLLQEKITGTRSSCNKETFLADVILDAGRAIEGIQSIEDLERLQGSNLPRGETMRKLRVVGLTDKLIGVTNGQSVLYRSMHDGYVFSYSAWPFEVDVNLGLAPVSYSGAKLETDTLGQAKTGIFACKCVDTFDSMSSEESFKLQCATAPYVQYIDDNMTNFENDVSHQISFPGLDLSGLKCNNIGIKIIPTRWPRRRLATSKGGTRGYTGYQRFSFQNFADSWESWATQDYDVINSLRMLSKTRALSASGKIDAVIYLQPICGQSESLQCSTVVENCYPWCLGIIKSGRQAQHIKMYNTQKWENHVLLTDVDCGIKRDTGFCNGVDASERAFMDLISGTTLVQGRCSFKEMCTSNSIPGQISSFVPLNSIESKEGDDLSNVKKNKKIWVGIRTKSQPFVVAGDVMLSVSNDNVIITRLYDIGMSALQMSNERLTLTSNAHTVKIASCETESSFSCVARHMHEGKVVLPRSFYQIGSSGASTSSIVNPAVASEWSTHWAVNPELAVYSSYFEYCRNVTSFSFIVESSLSRARVWTMNTMRAVDVEVNGIPSTEDVRSRVSYMRVPDFFNPTENLISCSVVVGLKIVGLEYLNPQNILVTVLAGEPRHYNTAAGDLDGPRHYRYYYLHPGRHDCVDVGESPTQQDFSCWRPESEGLWPDDKLIPANVGGLCVENQPVPAFGTMLIMPFVAWTSIMENILSAVSTFIACIIANPSNPALAIKQIFDVELRFSSFHSMIDSAGAQLFKVDDLINAGAWLGKFGAHVMILAVNTLMSITGGNNVPSKLVEKTVGGLRTIVMGQAKISEGGSIQQAPFADIENLFSSPLEFSALHASLAVLTLSDNIDSQYALPAIVRIFMRAQIILVSDFNIILRVGRIFVMRIIDVTSTLLSADDFKVTSSLTTTLLEVKPIVKMDWLDVMRFQCHGLAQMVGIQYPWGQALKHTCYLLPDTLEGLYTATEVFILDYPTTTCTCQTTQGGTIAKTTETVISLCLQKPLPLETQNWIQQYVFDDFMSSTLCMNFLDYSHRRLHSAFDKTFSRLYQLTEQASTVTDALLSTLTGDTMQCDAFDMSPYVVALIPEPVDYFSHCMHTNDCRVRCFDEILAFEQLRDQIPANFQTVQRDIDIPLESMLFSLEDIEKGRNQAPFLLKEVSELATDACAVVCGLNIPETEIILNRCLMVVGLQKKQIIQSSLGITSTTYDLASAYYCLPLDITQYTFEWELQKLQDLPPSDTLEGFASLSTEVLSVHVASTFQAAFGERDAIIVLGRQMTSTGENILIVEFYATGYPSMILLKTLNLVDTDSYSASDLRFAYLVDIEIVKVYPADVRGKMTTVDVYGRRKDHNGIPSMLSCVRLQFNPDPENFLGEDIQISVHPDFTDDHDTDHKNAAMQIATHYTTICLKEKTEDVLNLIDNNVCNEFFEIPLYHIPNEPNVFLKVKTFFNNVFHETTHYMTTQTKNMLGIASKNRVYFDMQQNQNIREVLISKFLYLSFEDLYLLRTRQFDSMPIIEILMANAEESTASWIQSLRFQLKDTNIDMQMKTSLSALTKLHVHKNCSIDSCDSCAKRQDGSTISAFSNVENLCYAAQQCAVSRCAGTLVNMRKPLCNIGKVITSDLHATRIILQGAWNLIADMSAAFVEITEIRKLKFEVQWPDEAIASMTCTMKDNIISTSASITSLLGATSYLMQDVSLYNSFVGSSVDSRVHARYIMTLVSTTNLISSIMLLPVYEILVAQKLISCSLNEVSFTIQNLINGRGQPELSAWIGQNGALQNSDTTNIFFGSARIQKVLIDADVAVCLTEDVARSLMDASAMTEHVKNLDFANPGDDGLEQSALTFGGVLELVSDSISVSIDIFLRTWAQYFFAIVDINLVWIESVLRSFVDIAQTIDWQGCKLPIIDSGFQLLGSCACGDQPYSIPMTEKQKHWYENAFWCSGFLMLNEGDGSDLIVWNPYSLDELLTTPNILEYVDCLKTRAIDSSEIQSCNQYKPQLPLLEMQGVELLQVISRCRANYQQSRWDEGVVMLGLFTYEEIITPLVYLDEKPSASKNDEFTFLRRKILKLIHDVQSTTTQSFDKTMSISRATWICLHDALNAGFLHHDCDKIDKQQNHFHYILPSHDLITTNFLHTDACKVFSNGEETLNIYGFSFPGFLWSGSSTNHAPLAKLHEEILSTEARMNIAESNLQSLIKDEIVPTLNQMTSDHLMQNLLDFLNVDAFSSEGDEFHQLLDCFFMGPFASSDFSSHFNFEDESSVSQYHRGNPRSRSFMPDPTPISADNTMRNTGGSKLRKEIIQFTFNHIDSKAEEFIAVAATDKLNHLKMLWTDTSNFYCTCENGLSSLDCCNAISSVHDIHFVLEDTMIHTVWNLHTNVVNNMWNYIQNNVDVLIRQIITEYKNVATSLTESQRERRANVHKFRHSYKLPVKTYDINDTPLIVGNESLWEYCTNALIGLHATLPFKNAEQNLEEGRTLDESTINVLNSDFLYEPAEDFDELKQHNMESVVERILKQAHAHSPNFWSHAHRYVASDSVWCEKNKGRIDVNQKSSKYTNLSVDEFWYDQHITQDKFAAPDIDQIFYVADVLNSCVCSWTLQNMCYIPDEVCQLGLHVLTELFLPDEKTRWIQLCESHTYDAIQDLLLVLFVLEKRSDGNDPVDLEWRQMCHTALPSLNWGLLDLDQQDFWYSGNTSLDFNNGWIMGKHNIATHGMNGLRISMLSSTAPQRIKDFVTQVNLGYALSGTYNKRHKHTIAQPVCNATLQDHLHASLVSYFQDVFFPMAHSVQSNPAISYCSRWFIELAILSSLRALKQNYASSIAHAANYDTIVEKQIATEQLWKSRCSTQLGDVALCQLHGVFDYYPDHASQPDASCPFSSTLKDISNCQIFYYTKSCLIFCDNVFYDPCLCQKQTQISCAIQAFDPLTCSDGQIPNANQIFDTNYNENLFTAALSWPDSISTAEGFDNFTEYSWNQLQQELMQMHSQTKQFINWTNVHNNMMNLMIVTPDEEEIPHAYCDDLYDYWPNVQHPIGYHNTPACEISKSSIRGFGSWMSQDIDGNILIDPIRMRNMTQSSQVHGKGHLLCDAYAYSSPGHDFSNMYLNTKWKRNSIADITIPRAADPITLSEMETTGTPSFESTETLFRGSGHSADQILQHSVGLIRDWAFWFTPHTQSISYNEYNRSYFQQQLDQFWPHWSKAEEQSENPSNAAGFYLSSSPEIETCEFPLQKLCINDEDCTGYDVYGQIELVCLINFALESKEGICAQKNTCYQHAHCTNDMMCSGEGECVQPYIYFQNLAEYDINVQLYAKSGCNVDTTNLGMFETISDFAQSNGMCSFRNWYHYQNLTKNAMLKDGLLSVSDSIFTPTNSEESKYVHNFLKPESHPCDRSYMHSDYKLCNLDAVRIENFQVQEPAMKTTATRTHIMSSENNKETDTVRFCYMNGNSITGFLNPFSNADSSLISSSQEINRCAIFERCPSIRFKVRGITFESRLVQVFVKNQDFTQPTPKQFTREYCTVDNQRCMGIGHLLGNDCLEATNNGEPLESTSDTSSAGDICVIDQFVLPLRKIVFQNAPGIGEETPMQKYENFVQHCPLAFSARFDGLSGFQLFENMYQILYSTYAFKPYKNNIQKKKIIKYANGLLLAVFGLSDEPAFKGRGGRGLSNIDHYLQLTQCVVYVTQEFEKEEFRLKEAGFTYTSATSIGVDAISYKASPGSSLYLFDQYTAIFMPLRWFLQCILFAASTSEGGVHSGFIPALLNSDISLAEYPEYTSCTNYNYEGSNADNNFVTLEHRLRTAPSPHIFTQKDEVQFSENQIVNDVDNLISYALDVLRLRSLPDLFCIENTKSVDTEDRNEFISFLQLFTFASTHLKRLRRNDVDYDQKQGVLKLSEYVETNIFKQVRSYLLQDKIDLNDVQWNDITLIELLNVDAIQDTKLELNTLVHENFTQYPRYQFNNLYNEGKLNALLQSPDASLYVSNQIAPCDCIFCYALAEPEYSIVPTTCQEISSLSCTESIERLLNSRVSSPFLTQRELLFLVLKIMQYEIGNSLGAGVESLHLLRSPFQAGPVANILRDKFDIENMASPNMDYMDLSEAKDFNKFMTGNEGTDGIQCSAYKNSIKYFTETNRMHQSLRSCYHSLQENVGWTLQKRQNLQINQIRTKVSANIMQNGFYAVFYEHTAEALFLRDLVSTKWSTAKHTNIENSMCFQHDEEVILMSPFWSEFFDVGAQNSLGCDVIRSAKDDTLFVYDSLCLSQEFETCTNHPHYLNSIQTKLSPRCLDENGKSVYRKNIGALKSTEIPLCDKKPPVTNACERKFGSLYGVSGSSVTDLTFKSVITEKQNGIWKSNNAIFKGLITDLTTPTALAIDQHDIAGHCLLFEVNANDILILKALNIYSDCDNVKSDWWQTSQHINNIEQLWAYQHRLAKKNIKSHNSNHWQCPASWLQKYHFDRNARSSERIYKARTPSSTRNQIRFQHLTETYSYAHPTATTSSALSKVRAAFFLSDVSACVENNPDYCHSSQYLSQTINGLMSAQKEWHIVAYKSRMDEGANCDHILDWPHI